MLSDGTGRAQLFLFNRPYLAAALKPGLALLIRDVPERSLAGIRFSGQAGTVELVGESDVRRIDAGETVVFYRATTVITQSRARQLAAEALERGLPTVRDPLPAALRTRHALPDLATTLTGVHVPKTWDDWMSARRRLVFEQLFLLQTALARKARELAAVRKRRVYKTEGPKLAAVRAALPFAPTGAQQRSMGEVAADLSRESPMNRLLQGDVGSGKTLVAAAAIAMAADSGYQTVVMAPTEILAEQHFQTFRRLLGPAGIRTGMLSGSTGRVERRQLAAGLTGGFFDLVVGTHALMEPGVEIPRLGVVVIDERHKFGVKQRAALEAKGIHPDVLMMTATPLPRALILTTYGDTTLSVLDEMPPGRGPVTTTWSHGAMQRDAAYKIVAERLAKGERAFAVFPLVEESEHLELRDATKEFERLRAAFKGAKVGLLTGRQSSDEKETVMRDFAAGKVNLLVCTTVVEVGIDVPEATVMLIEHANRFGLAQLHQLRGRIGRSSRPSWCLLITTGQVTADAKERVGAMVKTRDGFELAELDLKLRGPGELFGTRQSGENDAESLDLLLDPVLLQSARGEAEAVLAKDPDLKTPEGLLIREALSTRLSGSWGLARAS